eukprot:m.778 g.778  ORF g.778 m.778 type:complete len:332 (+) comp4837_c0_seq1:11-1006(+)
MDATGAKVLSLFLLFVISLLIGFFPLLFRKIFLKRKVKIALDFSSCFAGGIFLGTGLLHLIPDINKKFDAYYRKENVSVDYPVMQLCIGLGFIGVFLLDLGIPACKAKDDPFGHHHLKEGKQTDGVNEKAAEENNTMCEASVDFKNVSKEEPRSNTAKENPSLKHFILFVVLYLHGIFEGLAIGLLDTVAEILALLLAVSIHKSVILISLVVQLVSKNVKTGKSLVLVSVFSVVAPVGIVIGIAIDKTGSKESSGGLLASGILGGLATGTLFYVIFMEILPDGLKSGEFLFRKGLTVLLGFCIIALLSLIPEHNDNFESLYCNVTNSTVQK